MTKNMLVKNKKQNEQIANICLVVCGQNAFRRETVVGVIGNGSRTTQRVYGETWSAAAATMTMTRREIRIRQTYTTYLGTKHDNNGYVSVGPAAHTHMTTSHTCIRSSKGHVIIAPKTRWVRPAVRSGSKVGGGGLNDGENRLLPMN